MKKGLLVVAAVAALVIGVVVFFVFESRVRDPGPAAAPAVEAPEPVVVAPAEPATEPAPPAPERLDATPPELEAIPLPPLAESDAHAKAQLAEAVGEAGALQYFVDEALVARAVATLDALDSRQVPENIKAVAGPADAFLAVPDADPPTVILDEAGDPVPQYLSDPANARRYYPYVEMLEALDAERFAELYRKNYPLFEQAWSELGYPDGSFNDRLIEVIDDLLATPEVPEPYRLVKPEAVYLFVDEDLEALSGGQKMLLRMGPANVVRVKSKLAEFRQVLD